MTDNTERATVATVQPVAELFTSTATALWATTYSIDLALFSEFLLARLGDPPLNVAVLADHRRLAASLQRIPAERADTLATVNRRWLLRGVPITGAFHPKSYLIGRRQPCDAACRARGTCPPMAWTRAGRYSPPSGLALRSATPP